MPETEVLSPTAVDALPTDAIPKAIDFAKLEANVERFEALNTRLYAAYQKYHTMIAALAALHPQ